MESILIFLIIGAIMNFLQRGKEPQGKRSPQRPNAPAGTETQQDEVDWREIFRQEARTKSPQPKKLEEQTYTYTEVEKPTLSKAKSKQSNGKVESYEKAKRNKEKVTADELKSKDSPIYKDDITTQKNVKLDFTNISREEAIKGVVWSEILGKPRAKGSYRPTLNTRRKQG